MSKQIWLSPVLGNSRERLVDRCTELIRRGEADRFLYLTASHPLLELVTKWILDFDTIRGVMGTLPVFLFRGFVRHILATAEEVDTGRNLPRRVPIDTEESQLKKSLLSQVMRRLVACGELRALAPLAHRDGTVNTIATLIGEIQRAAKGPDEFNAIIESRARDLISVEKKIAADNEGEIKNLPRQLDFDREIGLIYEKYVSALDSFKLTENDADQLRCLQVFEGEVDSTQITVPWLDNVDLLILDGFFDFTPVQGEILRRLIPRIPNVIVNLYGDNENEEVFRPFADTVEQLRSMSEEFGAPIQQPLDANRAPAAIRTRLFNPDYVPTESEKNSSGENDVVDAAGQDGRASDVPRVFRCRDRETEIREIAKEIKRLVLFENYSIREIALIVRQRASYSETISRVFADEKIPCNVERVVALAEIPAVRAVLKLFRILEDERDSRDPRVADVADLIKSGYFRLSDESIRELRHDPSFPQEQLLEFDSQSLDSDSDQKTFSYSSLEDHGFGSWRPDELENVLAYVGGDLRLKRWLDRSAQLASNEKSAQDIRSQLLEANDTDTPDEQTEAESDSETPVKSGEAAAPTREIHPSLLTWTSKLLSKFADAIKNTPREGDPNELRKGLLKLLDELQFAQTIRKTLTDMSLESTLPHAALDLRALEGIRQATAWAIKSIEIAATLVQNDNPSRTISIEEFITEIERCVGSVTLSIASADLDGLQVLEATDVRGLQFRTIFIAGLIEGGFPLRKPRDWIYPHEERERLKDYGLTLEDISPATLLKEEHYFYQAASRATEHLYLTWPLVLEGDEETVVSYYIDELRHALAPCEIKNEEKLRDFEGDGLFESSTNSELATSLARLKERHRHHGRKSVAISDSEVDELLAWAKDAGLVTSSALDRITIGHEREGNRFSRYDGLISNGDLRTLLNQRFGPEYVWSASALSLYGKSPYKFFAERVLKLEPRVEAALDLAALDAGGLLHEVLRRFFTKHRSQRLASSDRNSLRAEMRSIAGQVFREREHAVPPLNIHVWKIDCEIYQLQLARVVDYEIELQSMEESDGVLPNYFELGFGMDRGLRDEYSTSEFLVMFREDKALAKSDSIKLRGQIDRIDTAKDGTVVAYDYKLSRGASERDMLEGRDLQIGIYLDAVEHLFFKDHQVAGGGYYVLRGLDRKRGLYREAFDRYTHLGTRAGSVLSDEKWFDYRATMRKRIWQFVDRIRAGRFVVDPTAPDQTCGICDFATVCRYERFRILRKAGRAQ